ncbi:hypothetical protein XA68_10407 [Ophiocordyceps unilateralis]|uniref:Uncharacterized protein n=1 Tax=Ophiocordyceps unilateralis TaxID=268505 RepID=A0A2A9PNC5_OPHUN|nr:hypothetical protein XA68_10407 [Ophiocordyceps unilateralis]
MCRFAVAAERTLSFCGGFFDASLRLLYLFPSLVLIYDSLFSHIICSYIHRILTLASSIIIIVIIIIIIISSASKNLFISTKHIPLAHLSSVTSANSCACARAHGEPCLRRRLPYTEVRHAQTSPSPGRPGRDLDRLPARSRDPGPRRRTTAYIYPAASLTHVTAKRLPAAAAAAVVGPSRRRRAAVLVLAGHTHRKCSRPGF